MSSCNRQQPIWRPLLKWTHKIWEIVELNLNPTSLVQHLYQIGKPKKTFWLMSVTWAEWKSKDLLLQNLFCNKIPFLISLWPMTKNRVYITTDSNQHGGWTKDEAQKRHSQSCLKRSFAVTVWWMANEIINYNFLNPKIWMTAEKYFFLFCTIMFTLYNPQEPLEVECYRVRGTVYVDMWER